MDKITLRYTVMDAVIILLICVGIVALVYSILGNDVAEFFAPKYEVSYTCEAENEAISALSEGDILTVTKTHLGKSKSIKIGKISSISASSTANKSYVTVKIVAYEVGGALFVDGYRLDDKSLIASTPLCGCIELDIITTTVLN